MTTKPLQSITLPIKNETTGIVENVTYTIPNFETVADLPDDLKTASFQNNTSAYKYENGVLKLALAKDNSQSNLTAYYTSAGFDDDDDIFETYDNDNPLYIKMDYDFNIPSGGNARIQLRFLAGETYYNENLVQSSQSASGQGLLINLKELWQELHPAINPSTITKVTIRGILYNSNSITGNVNMQGTIYGFYTKAQIDAGLNLQTKLEKIIEDTNQNTEDIEQNTEDIDRLYSLVESAINPDFEKDALLLFDELPTYYTAFANDPSSFNDIQYIEKKIRSIPNGKHLFFITDTHWDNARDNAQNSPMLLDYCKLRTGIDICIFGGDILNIQSTKYLANQVMYDFATKMHAVFGNKFLTAIGNHDQNLANYIDGSHTSEDIEAHFIPYLQVYKCLFEPSKSICKTYWDADFWTFETNTSTGITTWTNNNISNGDKIKLLSGDSTKYAELEAYGKMSYYVDDDVKKIRMIFLMCLSKPNYGAWYDLFQADTTRIYFGWLYHTLLSTPTDYDVVFCTHEMERPYDTTSKAHNLTAVVSAMLMGLKLKVNKHVYFQTGTSNENEFGSQKHIYFDFSGANNVGRALCLVGHCHTDGIMISTQNATDYDYVDRSVYSGGTLDQTTNVNDGCPIPFIYTTTDAYGRYLDGYPEKYTLEQKTEMTVNTITEQAFDIVSLTDSGIELTRIGAGDDRSIAMVW